MPRLHRPHVPLRVRVQVAERQLRERGETICYDGPPASSAYLEWLLHRLFGLEDVQLDHDPALTNRRRKCDSCSAYAGGDCCEGNPTYIPDANDPRYLAYRTKQEHRIKTLVRGDGAQLSDMAIRRKRKRKERKMKRPKKKWASRHFPKRKAHSPGVF